MYSNLCKLGISFQRVRGTITAAVEHVFGNLLKNDILRSNIALKQLVDGAIGPGSSIMAERRSQFDLNINSVIQSTDVHQV